MSNGLNKRSVTISGHRTSVSLEAPFWDALREIAEQDGISLNALITKIDAERSISNLSSALRIFVLEWFRSRQAPSEAL